MACYDLVFLDRYQSGSKLQHIEFAKRRRSEKMLASHLISTTHAFSII
ncbi:hypothetical protein ESCAB7627_2515 [Escherichia albertii TW07627]|uniref:Uncharacterized protein n=1 Tax=Escherichia albertii (strain TW07627) TaxID=502347 RepID=A0ABC9NP04_ESCAT|nr:hypothetical protein ESCAB7627_2515 [Escherichia albertii TW07627]